MTTSPALGPPSISADQGQPPGAQHVTFCDRPGHPRAVPHGRQWADFDDRQQCHSSMTAALARSSTPELADPGARDRRLRGADGLDERDELGGAWTCAVGGYGSWAGQECPRGARFARGPASRHGGSHTATVRRRPALVGDGAVRRGGAAGLWPVVRQFRPAAAAGGPAAALRAVRRGVRPGHDRDRSPGRRGDAVGLVRAAEGAVGRHSYVRLGTLPHSGRVQSPGQYRRLTHAHASATGVTRQGARRQSKLRPRTVQRETATAGGTSPRLCTFRAGRCTPITANTPASRGVHHAVRGRGPSFRIPRQRHAVANDF